MEEEEKPPKLLPLSKTLVFAFFLFSFLQLGGVSSLSSFSPADNFLINCGSSKPSTVDSDHREFKGDESFGYDSILLSATRSFSLIDPDPAGVLSPIYHSARIFTRPSSYAFHIRDRGAHLVRLHFRGFNSSKFDLIDVEFHAFAGEVLLLNGVSGLLTKDTKIIEYIVPVDSDKLMISFMPSKKSKFGFVNAIEVISAPNDLILDLAQFVNRDGAVKFDGFSKNALETIHRVNVGGPKVTPFNDSLWRTWVPDVQFLSSITESETVHFSGRIQYRMGGASREVAPDYVYNTGRVIRASNSSVPRSTISWAFPVIEGYKYLIRTHFCDIASIALNSLYFNVYVNGFLASENLDPSTVTNGMLASPFYADFVVDGVSSGVLTVSVEASNWSIPQGIDAILNGVEIMKLNNSMGSLDGEFSLHSVSENWPRGGVGFFVPLVAGICLLVAGFVVFYRQMFGVSDSVAWSRLPVDASEAKFKPSGP